jgi:hypothetical protein
MEKEFSRSQWIMIKSIPKAIRTDMGIYEKDLSVLNLPVTITQIGPSIPERLYLRSLKGNSCLISVFDKVVMPRLLVLANQLFTHLTLILANLIN